MVQRQHIAGSPARSSPIASPHGRNPRLTVRCEYPEAGMAPTEVTFRLSPSYGIHTGRASPLREFRLLPYLSQQDGNDEQ